MDRCDHTKLAEHFEEVADIMFHLDTNGSYIVSETIFLFYSALHYVDAYLSVFGSNDNDKHPQVHKNVRNQNESRYHIMQRYFDLEALGNYALLLQASHTSRYQRGFDLLTARHKVVGPIHRDSHKKLKDKILRAIAQNAPMPTP